MIIIGIVIVVIGATMVWKTDGYLSAFGQIPWAEANMHGGSYSFYKALGVLFCFVGLMGATGLLGGAMLWLLKPLFGALT